MRLDLCGCRSLQSAAARRSMRFLLGQSGFDRFSCFREWPFAFLVIPRTSVAFELMFFKKNFELSYGFYSIDRETIEEEMNCENRDRFLST